MDIHKQMLKAIRDCRISIQCSSPKLDLLLSLKTSEDSGLSAFYLLIDFKKELGKNNWFWNMYFTKAPTGSVPVGPSIYASDNFHTESRWEDNSSTL